MKLHQAMQQPHQPRGRPAGPIPGMGKGPPAQQSVRRPRRLACTHAPQLYVFSGCKETNLLLIFQN